MTNGIPSETNGKTPRTNGGDLLSCPFCGGEAHTYKNNLWHVACENANARCVTMSAFVTEAEAIDAWNTRAAVTDADFAMAVHDGELWGKCSECKERQGYYLDAETIQRQQERIAELERATEHYRLEIICYENDVDALVELICDMWKCLSAHIESAINDGGCGYPYSPQTRGCGEGCTVNGEDCSMSLIERRMRERGIEVNE